MEKIRVTKSQKFDVAIEALDLLETVAPEFSKTLSGTEDRESVTISISDLREFFKNEQSLLARKNASTADPNKMTDLQKENEAYKAEIKEFLATLPFGEGAPGGYSASEIWAGTSIREKYQLPKVTALLTAMGSGTKTKPGTNEIVRVKGPKGQTLFRLA